MSDKGLGAAMLAGGVIALIIYVFALFGYGIGSLAWQIALTVVAVIGVGAICVIIIWIGYTLATTPAPATPSFEPESTGATEKQEEPKPAGDEEKKP